MRSALRQALLPQSKGSPARSFSLWTRIQDAMDTPSKTYTEPTEGRS